MFICGIEDAQYKAEKISWWDNVYGFDFSSMKKHVIIEPLVDVVEPEACMTPACLFKTIDLNTCTREDLSFTADFALTATRNDYCHAFVSWFDCRFGCGDKPLTFTTGPLGRYTHWKQTVFYLEKDLFMNARETVAGKITVRPNSTNPRDQDVTIEYHFQGANHTEPIDVAQEFRIR
eukprot:c16667_g1_i2.p2 GENE.c16667_g1_i2~~c16667_g1_i2.p2  ORF type:complete len:177 (+),score=43.16 c16667_g1_i2:569-1099(+)